MFLDTYHSVWYVRSFSYTNVAKHISKIVNRDSATGPAGEAIHIDTYHSSLNKCSGLWGPLYKPILNAVKNMLVPSLLEQGDKQIRNSYTTETQGIERLSGRLLPMQECFINIAIGIKYLKPASP
jgi:hypothetical protein